MGGFVRRFAAAFLLLLGTIAAAAYIVDPYGYWGRSRVEGFNYWKPYAGRHVQYTKRRQYLWVAPKTVVAGNSRVEAGFDPESAAWPAAAQPVYNFGIRGANMQTVAASLLDVIDKAPPERIYLALDFTDFLASEAAWRSAAPPAPSEDSGLVEQAAVAGRTLLSLNALKDTANTVLLQNSAGNKHLSPLGFNPLMHFVPMVREEGHHSLFRTTLRQTRERYGSRGTRTSWPGPGANLAWLALESLADRAQARGVDLVLFTYPFRTEALGLFSELGLDAAQRRWACDVAAFARQRSLPVWDFTVRDAVTAEPVPPAGDHRPMRWWWEVGHFKPSVGDLMIRRMAREQGRFGAPLAPSGSASCPAPEIRVSQLGG